MLNPSKFRNLLKRRGIFPPVLRLGLRAAEVPYTWAICWRNWRYDSGTVATYRVGVPVVSVGNLTLGGTGKTPMVEWIARWFHRHGAQVAIISRGYGSKAGRPNDEALELAEKLPDVPHLQNPNRLDAAHKAVEELGCQLIVLDDAFQHRRVYRELNIVMLDALEPFGFGHVFPRGTLREPVAALGRADVVVLSRADMLDSRQRDRIWRAARHNAPNALWMEVAHAPRALVSSSGCEEPPESLAGSAVAAFCGIGNPAGFRHTLEASGYKVAAFREFPDHHCYNRRNLKSLADWAARLDVAAVLCTHKDLVKLDVDQLGDRPLRAVSVGLEILAGQEKFEDRLRKLLPRQAKSLK